MSTSTELKNPDITYKEYTRKYQRERARGIVHIHIKPSVVIRLKNYYDEYITACQQNQYAIVEFHEWITQFCEIGFFSWRDRNKHK